jgi:hypothetical protein
MNRTEHLLTCAAEECNEVAQRVSKALRFGLLEVQPGQPLTNAERIIQEFHDLFAVMEMLVDADAIPLTIISDHSVVLAKMSKIERFMAISREQGVLS